MSWNEAEISHLKTLCERNEYFMSEIAEILGKNSGSVRWEAHRLGVWSKPKNRMGQWNNKHAHLRERLLKYYLSHSAEETQKYFNLTPSQFKSCLTYAYIDPKLKHLRKDTRLHTSWSDDDWTFMLKHSGIRPREWIAKKLKRGKTYNSVKDALAKFRGLGKYMNGMPIGWAQEVFTDLPSSIKTKAGPTGCTKRGSDFRYRLIPWVEMEKFTRRKRLKPEIKISIKAMAKFQRWIHGGLSDQEIVKFLTQAARCK